VTGVGGTTSFNTGVLSDLQLPTAHSSPNPTGTVATTVNLNSSDALPNPWTGSSPPPPDEYNSSTSTTLYDSLGNAHTATMYFRKDTSSPPIANQWEQYLYIDGVAQAPTAGGDTLTFNGTGALTGGGSKTYDVTWTNGAAPQTFELDFTGTTQFGSSFAVNNLTQDGYTTGRLAGVDIDNEGIVFARYTNGQSSALGKVAMAKFNNQQGLRQVGDSNWAESFASGQPQFGEAGTSSFGQIQSGALEASNVDIAAQLVNLITAQRNFQANAEVISTSDAVTQTVINIR